MAGTFTGKVLANGSQASSTTATIYTVPASTTTTVRSLRLFSNSGIVANSSAKVRINATGADRDVHFRDFSTGSIHESVLSGNEVWVLETGDTISLVTGSGSQIIYTISGFEET